MESLVQKRWDIVDQVKGIRVQQSQALRQVKVPDQTIRLAKDFVKKAPNVCLLRGRNMDLRYEVLGSFYVDRQCGKFGVYELLARDAGKSTVKMADQKFTEWLAAVGSLLRYALNLLLAPKRPEFQTIKVSSVYYHCSIVV